MDIIEIPEVGIDYERGFKMRVGFGCDHRGFKTRESIMSLLMRLGHECIDFGTDSAEPPVDYMDIAYTASMTVAKSETDRAILVCSTGIRMCMAANKVKGTRSGNQMNAIILKIILQFQKYSSLIGTPLFSKFKFRRQGLH